MTKSLLTILTLLFAQSGFAQYYIRGDVKDKNNVAIQNARIYRPSTRNVYFSGQTGGFGIPSSHLYDSLVITKDGYDSLCVKIKTDVYQRFTLEISTKVDEPVVQKMASFTTGLNEYASPISVYRGETYTNLVENDFVKTSDAAQTIFGIRIDKASYSNIRRFTNQNVEIPPDAVRIDEMLNYFNLNYKEPESPNKFRFESQVTDCPWNPLHRLLLVSLSAAKLNLDSLPPSNFVFLIDVSGSMDLPNRLPLLKEAFQLFIKNLRAKDTVSIVVYGGTVGIWLTPTGGAEKEKISKSIEELEASGDTPGESAIRTAYQLAKNTFIEGGNNRVILATDGDFNIGVNSEEELEKLITKERDLGVYLTCLGVGMGNYKDSKIEVLSKKGKGNFAYIDNIQEAERVLITQFTQTMYAVASDVYMKVKFNPKVIDEYRLIGYDNKQSGIKNFIGTPEGGEVGSGSCNTIVFEFKPSGMTDGKKNYQAGSFSVHYTEPGDTLSKYQEYQCPYNYLPFSEISKPLQFATAVTMFGLKLKKSAYFPNTSWDAISNIATESRDPGNFLQTQFSELIVRCKKIYDSRRKKRR